jgi:transposase
MGEVPGPGTATAASSPGPVSGSSLMVKCRGHRDGGRVGDAGGVTRDQERPDPEVPQKARRRTFTAAYKQEVLAAYEAAADG